MQPIIACWSTHNCGRPRNSISITYRASPTRPARPPTACATVTSFDDQPPAIDDLVALLQDKKPAGGAQDARSAGWRPDARSRASGRALSLRKIGGRRWIEGWIEGPCAESADLRGINRLMTDFFDDTAFVHDLFEFTVELGLRFAKAQVEAGVDMHRRGMRPPRWSVRGSTTSSSCPTRNVSSTACTPWGPGPPAYRGNTRRILGGMGPGCELVDVDWKVPLALAAGDGPGQVLAGSIDPVRSPAGQHAGRDRRRPGRVLCGGRPTVYCRRRLRSPPRHAAVENVRAMFRGAEG